MFKRRFKKTTIDIRGVATKIFGIPDDEYSENLAAHAAQNGTLLKLLDTLPTNATVIDVGANIGVTSAMASRYVKGGRVVAIEPSSKAYECLHKTVSDNSLTNVTALNIAAGSSAGHIGFVESNFLAGSYVAADAREDSQGLVEVVTLDDICRMQELSRVDLVKIDVEGFELDVLQGATQLIEKYNPMFLVEFNSFALAANRNISPRKVLDFILDRYDSFRADRDGETIVISSDDDARHFMYSNMAVRGCIDDIYFGGTQ